MRSLPGALIIVLVVASIVLIVLALRASNYLGGSSIGSASSSGQGVITTSSPASTSVSGRASVPRGTYVVMLGDPRCPHCRAMERFFEVYSAETGVRAFFCSVLDRVCADAFWKLYRVGATQGVPTIIACRDNRVGFIEVGELENSEWWSTKLASMKPLTAGKVPVFIAGSLYREVEIDRALATELCSTILSHSKPIG